MGGSCCVEAECHFCYLRDSSVYVHESCCLGNQRHPLTYVGLRRFWYGPLPNMVADFRDTYDYSQSNNSNNWVHTLAIV